MASFWNSHTTVTLTLALALITALYIYQGQTLFSFTMPATSSSPIDGVPGLEFKLHSISQNQNRPSLLVTLRNSDFDNAYTILSWGTPFDDAATNTGVFTLIDTENGSEVDQVVLQINRMMPPPEAQLVTVAPGAEETIEMVFDKPWMPKKRSAKYKVTAEGTFTGVWRKHKSEVTEDDLDDYLSSPYSGRKFTTNEVVLEAN